MKKPLDRRLHAYRDDLADIALKDQVQAAKYVTPVPAYVTSHFTDCLSQPDQSAGMDTQFLHGERLNVFDEDGAWNWVQRESDGYVGYVRAAEIRTGTLDCNYIVTAPRTFLYPEPDLKAPRCGYRSMGSHLQIVAHEERRGTNYGQTDHGQWSVASHIALIDQPLSDYVSVAETLLHTPYLWGGSTGFGIDCSGLVQLSASLCGLSIPRDSDMQAERAGEEIEPDYTALRRGDLVFWKGHVGIMCDAKRLIHANGNTMNVAIEDLADAIERIGYLYGEPKGVRRFPGLNL